MNAQGSTLGHRLLPRRSLPSCKRKVAAWRTAFEAALVPSSATISQHSSELVLFSPSMALPTKKPLFIQEESSDDDKPLVKKSTPKSNAQLLKKPKKHAAAPQAEENVKKRAASPHLEEQAVPKKSAKSSRRSDAPSGRTKKPMEDDQDSVNAVAAPEKPVTSHKTLRFDMAVASLLIDGPAHPMYDAHFDEAMTTCRVAKKDPEKLQDVLQAIHSKAMEMDYEDDSANTAITNARGCFLKKQASLAAAEVISSADLMTLVESVITKVEDKSRLELQDPISLRKLCEDFTVVIKRKRGQPVLGGYLADTVALSDTRSAHEEDASKIKERIKDRRKPAIQTPEATNLNALDKRVEHAVKGLSAVQNVTPFYKMGKCQRREELSKAFTSPKDLFVAYVKQDLQAAAESVGIESNHARYYDIAANKWDSFDAEELRKWGGRFNQLCNSLNLSMLTQFIQGHDVVDLDMHHQTASKPPQRNMINPQQSTRQEKPDVWGGNLPSRPSPKPTGQTVGFGPHLSEGRPSGAAEGEHRVNYESSRGAGDLYRPQYRPPQKGRIGQDVRGPQAIRKHPPAAPAALRGRDSWYAANNNRY